MPYPRPTRPTLSPEQGFVDGIKTAIPGFRFVLADKDGDGDFDALTAVAWEDSTKSGSGTINWNSTFGVSSVARMIKVIVFATDATAGATFDLKAKSTTTNPSFRCRIQVANVQLALQGDVPIASDGTSYYNFSEAFDAFYLRVVGWYV